MLGKELVTVIEGEITHRLENAEERIVRTGESFEESLGHHSSAGNHLQCNLAHVAMYQTCVDIIREALAA